MYTIKLFYYLWASKVLKAKVEWREISRELWLRRAMFDFTVKILMKNKPFIQLNNLYIYVNRNFSNKHHVTDKNYTSITFSLHTKKS